MKLLEILIRFWIFVLNHTIKWQNMMHMLHNLCDKLFKSTTTKNVSLCAFIIFSIVNIWVSAVWWRRHDLYLIMTYIAPFCSSVCHYTLLWMYSISFPTKQQHIFIFCGEKWDFINAFQFYLFETWRAQMSKSNL